MQATLSTRRFAAALLLSPIAAAVMASPALAQHGSPDYGQGQRAAHVATIQPLVIERFAVRAHSIEPGREMRFRLLGSPGAHAEVDIPRIVQDVPLREVQPGHFHACWKTTLSPIAP